VNGEVVVVDDVATAFADLVVREAPRTIALSGGGTARRCYETLASRSGIDWSGVTVLFGDERLVPVDHADSNEGMAREELLDHVAVGAVHSMTDSTADDYDDLVRRLGGIDLIHLGLGPDGHTASLVPGGPVLEVRDRRVAVTGEYQGRRRMTLTYPALEAARTVLWLVTGADKPEALAKLRAGDPSVPAGRLRAWNAVLLADRAAAGEAAVGDA
jgi:6-phosphogluconolactonase